MATSEVQCVATTMRSVVKANPEPAAVLVERPVPEPGYGQVRLKILATSICGTDLHVWNWDPWAQGRVKPPLIMGHELAGVVDALGPGVSRLKVGDYVSAESHLVCGVCYFCQSGRGHLCVETQIIGVDTDGCFAEYIVMPESNCQLNDPALPKEIASIQEPLGNAVHTALAQDLVGKTVAVVGVGPLGLMAVPVARLAGAGRVIAIDVNEYRLGLAAELGATQVVHALRDDPVALLKRAGVDVVLEMSGSPQALNQALEYINPGGDVSLLGLPASAVELDLANKVIMKGLTLHGITGRKMYQTWQQVAGLMQAGLGEALAKVVTHTLPLADVAKGMELMQSGDCGKVVLIP